MTPIQLIRLSREIVKRRRDELKMLSYLVRVAVLGKESSFKKFLSLLEGREAVRGVDLREIGFGYKKMKMEEK